MRRDFFSIWNRRTEDRKRHAMADRRRAGHARRRSRLEHEPLERRQLLAITTLAGHQGHERGIASNFLIVASDADVAGEAASDVFIQRRADGELYIADNSSFLPNRNFREHASPDLLYVTNAAPAAIAGTLSPGDNRSTVNGGPGFDADPVPRSQTVFVLRNGSVNVPSPNFYADGVSLGGPINGSVAFNGSTWTFEFPDFSAIATITSGPQVGRPLGIRLNQGSHVVAGNFSEFQELNGAGRGERGTIEITWPSFVPTVSATGHPAPPTLDINYTADNDIEPNRVEYTVSEVGMLPSAADEPSFLFDIGGPIVDGSLRGVIYVDSWSIGGRTRGLRIPFVTDPAQGSRLLFQNESYFTYYEAAFDPYSVQRGRSTEWRPFGELDWLRVSGSYSAVSSTDSSGASARIRLTFENRFNGPGFLTNPTGASEFISPGPVALENVTWLEHVTPDKPNSFTLFAGHDLRSQVRADLTAYGSSINIDSPVLAPSREDMLDEVEVNGTSYVEGNVTDIDLRATNVNLNAQVQSTDHLYIGRSRINGTPAERVRLNAALAVPGTAEFQLANEIRNDNSGGPRKGELLVSQSGRLSAQLRPLTIPFGDPGVAVLSSEIEPNNFAQQSNNLQGSFTRVGDETYLARLRGEIVDGDQDWFRLDVLPGDFLVFDMEGSATGVGTQRDPLLDLYAADGTTRIAGDDDSGSGLNAQLRYQVPLNNAAPNTPLTLYVRATGYSGSRGTYQLTATAYRQPAVPTQILLVDALVSDVIVEGFVYATAQSWLMQSETSAKDRAPFRLTTRSQATGAATGLIRGDTTAITLGNDADTPLNDSIAFNVLDIDTAVRSLRVRASTRLGDANPIINPFPYQLTVREEDALLVDAVAATSLPVSVASDGAIGFTSSLETAGDIRIATRRIRSDYNSFQVAGPMTTTKGRIDIAGSSIYVANTMAVTDATIDPARTDISLTAINGGIDLNGLTSARNDISLVQRTPDAKGSRIQGSGLVRGRNLRLIADSVGNRFVDQTNPLFFLKTEVDTIFAAATEGFAINEVDDVALPQLEVPAGLVALVANGTDGRPGSPNPVALTARGIDVSSLIVSAPNGSIDVRIDTDRDVVLGEPVSLKNGTGISATAAGDVTIRSSAGSFRVLDGAFAGSGARKVRMATTSTLTATYSPGLPGQIASTLDVAATGFNASFGGRGDLLRVGDRVLVKDGVNGVAADQANGVYTVIRQGSSSLNWLLRRAEDSDTLGELPTGAVVFVTEAGSRGEYRRLSHAMTATSQFGTTSIVASPAFQVRTQIGSDLPLPNTVIDFVVSSTQGTNTAAGSLGKMIALRQANDIRGTGNPDQRMSLSFSALIGGSIQLTEELPVIIRPLGGGPVDIDGNRRFLGPFPEGIQPPADNRITIDGTVISRRNTGEPVVSTTVSASPALETPLDPKSTTILVAGTTSDIRVGMAVSGVGIRPGTRVKTVTVDGPGRIVELTDPRDDWRTGSRPVTFATEINGFVLDADARGAAVSNLAIGGFGQGAAIKVLTPKVVDATSGDTTPGVTISGMRIGATWPYAGVQTRRGNETGIVVAGSGSARIQGGTITSSSGAGIRTQDQADHVVLEGVTVGTRDLFNVYGLDLAGTGTVRVGTPPVPGATPTATPVPTARNVIEFNRTGVDLRRGATTIINTDIRNNSFDGVRILPGSEVSYTIGDSATRSATSNVISGNGRWGINIADAAKPANPQVDGRRIRGNYLGVTQANAAAPNIGGNVGVSDATSPNGVAAPAELGFRPSRSGLDIHGNLHRPWPVEPTVYVATPGDNSPADLSATDDIVSVKGSAASVASIELWLEDDGNAINDAGITAAAFAVRYTPNIAESNWDAPTVERWTAGNQYGFRYDAVTNRVFIESVNGQPLPGGSYRIQLVRTAVRDIGGNQVLANDVAGPGTTAVIVRLDPDVVDPGNPTDPTTLPIGPAATIGQTLYVPATTEATRDIKIVNDGDIVIQGLVQTTAAGKRITVESRNGRVIFEPAGSFRSDAVELKAVGDSDLVVESNVVIRSASVTNGRLAIASPGGVRQSNPSGTFAGGIIARSLVVTGRGGAVALANPNNQVDDFSATSPGSVNFVNARGFRVGGTGVSAGSAADVDGEISLSALTGNLDVAAALTAPGDIAILRASAGRVMRQTGFVNGVQTLIEEDSTGNRVTGGFIVATAARLAEAASRINALAANATYQIIVAASFPLDAAITFNRAVAISGRVPGLTLSGSATVRSGLIFNASATGSRVSGLAFANFAGTAISVTNARNVAISGITVANSGTGLLLAGTVAGSTVRGSVFRSVGAGLRLQGAQGAVIGGTTAAQRNRIVGASVAGVVATGICTNTQIIGMTFAATPRTNVTFVTTGVRGLKISGTIVERATR